MLGREGNEAYLWLVIVHSKMKYWSSSVHTVLLMLQVLVQ